MTRVLLPVLIAIVALLLGSMLIPIAIRQFFGLWIYRREIEEWAGDVRWDE